MYKVALGNSCFPAQQDFAIHETTVGGILRDQARRSPDALALIEIDPSGQSGRRWTYDALLIDAERLARALLSRFEPGERICIWAPNVPEWVIVEFAAGLAGLILVTANPAYQDRELRFVLEQSKACALLLVNEYRGNPMAAIGARVAAEIPNVRAIIDIEDHGTLFAGDERSKALPDVMPLDPVQIQYTSGTTGFPKGAVISHRAITNNARFHYLLSGVRGGEIAINFMPLFHTASCGLLTLGSTQFGCAMALARIFDASAMLDAIERERVNYLIGVPTMMARLVDAQKTRPRDTSSVTVAATGGATVAPELLRQVREVLGWDLLTVYGQTESAPLLTQVRHDDPRDVRSTTVGQAFPQTEISIRDHLTNEVVELGEVGEICTRGYAVMIGYNDNPEATAATIDADGWLHTGDLGTMDERGFVRVTGRVKDMIIRGGENLFPAEIEAVLLEHPAIAEAAVVGMPDERWGEIVAAFVRLVADSELDETSFILHCRERIAPYKTPVHWIEVAEWPLTGSGKIQKFVLRERLQQGLYSLGKSNRQ